MALGHTRPPDSLLRELREVARDSAELVAVLDRGLNFPLPPEFPVAQLADICRSLMQLPEGTAEGCRSPLDYARHRLPAIRRQHIATEELEVKSDEPALVRGALLDQRLGTLISSVSTALDEYRSLASEEVDVDFRAEAGIVPKPTSVEEAVKGTKLLDSELAKAENTVDAVAESSSRKADDLKRQLKDARGLNKLSSAEIRMPRVVLSWLRKTVNALRQSPRIISTTVKAMRVGTDVSKLFVDRWHDFQKEGTNFVFAQIHKTLDAIEQAGGIVNNSAERKIDDDDDQPARYRVSDLTLDRFSHRVTRAGEPILLQPREFRLLEYLMKHTGQVVTRTMLLENVWDYHFDPQTNVIDVHISRLRGKIDKGFAKQLIHTVRGAGYMLRDGAD